MRLFTGIRLPASQEEQLGELLARLRAESPAQNWSPRENLHITVKFVGEFPEARLGELRPALAGLPAGAPRITLRGLGWLPNPHRPRVLFVPVQATDALAELARRTDAALEELGVARETRAYAPHVTLARIKSTETLGPARQAIAALPSVEFGSFTPEQFHLYQSQTGPRGSVYTIRESFSFAS